MIRYAYILIGYTLLIGSYQTSDLGFRIFIQICSLVVFLSILTGRIK